MPEERAERKSPFLDPRIGARDTEQWVADWREGQFTPAPTDDGWTVEMHGLAASAETHARDLILAVDALVRIGGLKADGSEGWHFVGDEQHPDECPGCRAWWGLGLGARPTQDDLDALRAVEAC